MPIKPCYNLFLRMNQTDSVTDDDIYDRNRDEIQLRIIFLCFALGVGVGVMICVQIGRKVKLFINRKISKFKINFR